MIRVMMVVWTQEGMADKRTMTVGEESPEGVLASATEWLRKAVGATPGPTLWGDEPPDVDDEDGERLHP